MFGVFKYFLYSLVLVMCANAAKFPKYITPCKRNDPNLNACVKKETIHALPFILAGDKNIKVPSLKPFKLPEVTLEAGNNLKIKLVDVVLNGLDDNEVKDVSVDIKKQTFHINIVMHRLNLVSQYEIEGRILVLPINGKGPANITFVEGDFVYDVHFDIENRNGKDYIKLGNPTLSFTTKRCYYHLDNLFNGDQRLGEEMNKFLDENWKDVTKDLGPAVSEVVSTIATSIGKGVLEPFPYDVILLP